MGISENAKVLRKQVVKNKPGPRDGFDPATMLKTATLMCKGGATMAELADAFNISSATLYRWLNTYPELRAAVDIGVDTFNPRVERALAESAIGYFVTLQEGYYERGMWVPPKRQYIKPDVTSQIFFLKNRMPDKYRDVHKIDGELRVLKTSDELRIKIQREILQLQAEGYDPKIIDVD